MIQGGDPNSKDTDPRNDGYGSSTYPNLPAEFSNVPYERGIVGAARANDPNSANSQFFIMLKRQSAFDNSYTVFGRVIEGLANAYIINISPTERGTERPEDPVVIKRATLQKKY
jgi:cyclophilin family peptidyl-prolyl cis-trans isomerase